MDLKNGVPEAEVYAKQVLQFLQNNSRDFKPKNYVRYTGIRSWLVKKYAKRFLYNAEYFSFRHSCHLGDSPLPPAGGEGGICINFKTSRVFLSSLIFSRLHRSYVVPKQFKQVSIVGMCCLLIERNGYIVRDRFSPWQRINSKIHQWDSNKLGFLQVLFDALLKIYVKFVNLTKRLCIFLKIQHYVSCSVNIRNCVLYFF